MCSSSSFPFSSSANAEQMFSFTRNSIVLIETIRLFPKWDERCFDYCFVLRRLIFSVNEEAKLNVPIVQHNTFACKSSWHDWQDWYICLLVSKWKLNFNVIFCNTPDSCQLVVQLDIDISIRFKELFLQCRGTALSRQYSHLNIDFFVEKDGLRV